MNGDALYDMATILPPSTFAPPALISSTTAETVLEGCTASSMIGVLQQLGELAHRANEIFSALTADTARSASRVGSLKHRLGAAAVRICRLDEALSTANAEELVNICNAAPHVEYKASPEEISGLFTADSRPAVLQAAFDAARAPPQLHLLDTFVQRPEGRYAKYGLVETCANLFSDRHFFLKQWLDEEERNVNALKAEKKARRAERRERPGAHDAHVKKGEAKRIAKKRYLTYEEQLGLVLVPVVG